MFSRVASLLALLPMLLHSILGCCWHHAHECVCISPSARAACVAGIESVAEEEAGHTATRCHHHEHGAGVAGDQPAEPCPHSPCDEERCLFASTSLAAPQQVAALEWMLCSVFAVTADLPVPSGSLLSVSRDLVDGRPSLPAQQRRALAQVWLV